MRRRATSCRDARASPASTILSPDGRHSAPARADHRRLGRHRRGVRPGLRGAGLRPGAGGAAGRPAGGAGGASWPPRTAIEAFAIRADLAVFEAERAVLAAVAARRPACRRAGQQRRLLDPAELRRRALGAAARLPDDPGGQRLRPGPRGDPRHGRARRRARSSTSPRSPASRRAWPATPSIRPPRASRSSSAEALDAEYGGKGITGHRPLPGLHPHRVRPGQRHAGGDGRLAAHVLPDRRAGGRGGHPRQRARAGWWSCRAGTTSSPPPCCTICPSRWSRRSCVAGSAQISSRLRSCEGRDVASTSTWSSSAPARAARRLAQRLAPTGKSILILERGEHLPREAENWEPQGGVHRAPLPHQGALVRQARQALHAQHPLLGRRQHHLLRRGPDAAARARLRGDAARRRRLARLADLA